MGFAKHSSEFFGSVKRRRPLQQEDLRGTESIVFLRHRL